MKIGVQLDNDPKIGKTLLWCLIPVIFSALLAVYAATEWLEFIKAVADRKELIRITAGMGILPTSLGLLMMFGMGAIMGGLMLIAQYTKHQGLMDYDPSKSWATHCLRVCIYSLVVFIAFYFMFPVFSDRIAEKLGYEYYCSKELHISGPRYGFFEYTYAKGPDLCPTTEDYRPESRRISPSVP